MAKSSHSSCEPIPLADSALTLCMMEVRTHMNQLCNSAWCVYIARTSQRTAGGGDGGGGAGLACMHTGGGGGGACTHMPCGLVLKQQRHHCVRHKLRNVGCAGAELGAPGPAQTHQSGVCWRRCLRLRRDKGELVASGGAYVCDGAVSHCTTMACSAVAVAVRQHTRQQYSTAATFFSCAVMSQLCLHVLLRLEPSSCVCSDRTFTYYSCFCANALA